MPIDHGYWTMFILPLTQGEPEMWGIQYKTVDECETVWRTLILFRTEEEAVRTCREINIRANKFNTFRVRRITEVESANGFRPM